MSLNAMSSSQYGSLKSGTPAGGYGGPVTHSATTMGSIGSKTAWSTASLGSAPTAYSKRTKGSTLSWDDDGGSFQMPQSDAGSPYILNKG